MAIKFSVVSSRSESGLLSQKWLHKMVRYEEGRTGQVIDMSLDGKRLCIWRETVRGADSERSVIWKNSDDVEILDVKRRNPKED